LQRQACEIGLMDLLRTISSRLLVLGLRKKAITHAWHQATSTPRTLNSARLGNALCREAGHATDWVEPWHSLQTGVDHYSHALNGQARLGDVGRQYDLALAWWSRFDSRTLCIQIQLTMQGAQQQVVTP